MVNPALIVAAAIFVGIIFIRKEIGETGVELGRAFGGLGTGLGTLGKGIQTFVSATLSPKIRPELVPTLGLKLELPFGIGGSGAPDDREGGRTEVAALPPRIGEPPIRGPISDVRSGARAERLGGLELREAQLRGGFFH